MTSPDVESASGSTHSFNDLGTTPLTLDERRRSALSEIDDAKFTWFHLKVTLVASIGMFTDAYDIFTITAVSTMLGYVYGDFVVVTGTATTSNSTASDFLALTYQALDSRALKLNDDLGLKAATLGGAIFGQLVFGWLGDFVGRKKMYGIELVIMVVSTFVQALAGETKTGSVSIVSALIVWRVLMSVGIGGDYPLSAIIVSEFSPIRIRGRLMTIVISFYGIGTVAAALVSLVVVSAFKREIITNSQSSPFSLELVQSSVDQMWRLLIGLGCIPAVLGLYFRFTVPETPRFTIDIERNLDQARADIDTSLNREETGYDGEVTHRVAVPKASWNDFIHYFSTWENIRVLLGASYSWFAIDAIFYGLSLNTTELYGDNPFNVNGNCENVWICDKLYNNSATAVILTILALPGYAVSFAFVDSWGRKPVQLMGFTALAILFIALGSAFPRLTKAGPGGNDAITFLYCLASFFQNFGPNVTTFVIPGELFPTRYRSTCYGIIAASGKVGATLALVIFYYVPAGHLHIALIVFGCFMLTGVGSTLWLPEPKGRSLESLSNETQKGITYTMYFCLFGNPGCCSTVSVS
ncbi:Major facilitator superfamily domain containing protein [Amanita muscaria]